MVLGEIVVLFGSGDRFLIGMMLGAIAFLDVGAIASLTDIQDDSSYPPFQAPAKSKLNSAQSPQ